MKILRLELENFEAIKHCMHTNRIVIDFQKTQNKICLLIGPNGSGKTTILSLLNPFATLGNLDVRDGFGLILPHKNGRKEIWIQDGSNIYKIQHFYTASKETHFTKSFIQKNDVELNPNGNVTSFKEKVKEELSLELDYLKLVRLGPNVKSLIELSSTERKNFMVNLLDDIGIYTQYYKHVNGNMRTLKEMLSHTMDKIKRCQYNDEKEYKVELAALDHTITSLETRLREIQDAFAIYDNKAKELGDMIELESTLREHQKKLKKMERAREKMGGDVKHASYYQEAYQKALSDTQKYGALVEASQILLSRELEHRNELEERVQSLSIQLEQEASMDHEVQKMQDLLDHTSKTIQEQTDLLKGFHSDLDLDAFEEFYSFLKASELALRKTYEFGQDPIKDVVDLIREKQNVANVINSGLLDATEADGAEAFLSRIRKIGNFSKEIACEQKSTCDAFRVWQYFSNLFIDRNPKMKRTVEYYHDMELIYESIMHIVNGFKLYPKIVEKLPKKLKSQFTAQAVLLRIEKGKPLYEESSMDQFYARLKDLYGLSDLKKQREKLFEDLERLQRFSKSHIIREDYQRVSEDLEKSKTMLSSIRDDIQDYRVKKQEAEFTAESMGDAADACENYERVYQETEELLSKRQAYQQYDARLHEIAVDIRSYTKDLEEKRKERSRLETDRQLFVEMQKNLVTYQLHYDNMEYTKKALSASKGIPTLIVKHYLRDTESITNELLDIAYEGEVRVEPFDISADTFSIPVWIHGARRPDVKLASQGEVAFLSVALSFALISQSLGRYNIMSLDEVDGPLDRENRQKFIDILENQIERVGSEQNFLITHNEIFATYPVDILDLSFSKETKSRYTMANFIPIIRD